jgi:hypothetical protein
MSALTNGDSADGVVTIIIIIMNSMIILLGLYAGVKVQSLIEWVSCNLELIFITSI